jgi:hypothetical protein
MDRCKVYMDSYMALNESCYMVTWIISKNHLLEVGLTPNHETMTLGNAHNHWHIILYHAWGSVTDHIWLHTTLESPWPHYMILEVSWDGLWTRSIGLSQFWWSRLVLVCEVALINVQGEPIFSVVAADLFCEKSGWIGKSGECETNAFKKTGFQLTTILRRRILPGCIVK